MRRDNREIEIREFEIHDTGFRRILPKFKKHKVKVNKDHPRRERPIDHDSLSVQPNDQDR
jgi:hypothetical protein